jgi:hypothetical protein
MSKKKDLWENDPTLIPLPKKALERSREMTFQNLKKSGVKPDSIRDKDMAKEYAAWLADQQ